jgi:hypothetical protein
MMFGKKDEDAMVGDLAETYNEIAENSGKRCADYWYYKQVVLSIPFLIRRLAAKFELFAKRTW